MTQLSNLVNINKQLNLNAFHVVILGFVINLIFGYNDYIINFIDYIMTISVSGFMFLSIHILLAYLILIHLQFDFGFHTAIHFTL